jgi:hypothetical protein
MKTKKKKMPLIIFAPTDEDLIDQLPDASEIKEIQEIADMTYKIILR